MRGERLIGGLGHPWPRRGFAGGQQHQLGEWFKRLILAGAFRDQAADIGIAHAEIIADFNIMRQFIW